MDSKGLRSLMEAYQQINTPQEVELDEAKKKLPYVKMFRKAGNLGRDGSPEAMERSKKITGVMNKNAERVAAHRDRDDAAKKSKAAKKAKMKEEVDQVDEKFSMAVDSSKPQSPRPTKMPKSRERNIGKHNDWKDNPNRDFGERPEKGKKLKSRASAVVQSQRRTDKEVGVREKHELDVFDTILEFLIAEEIAQDIQEANWIMANAITEEQIDEILGMLMKKAEKKTEYAGRSMEPVKKDPGYTVDKRRPEVSVTSYGKGGKTDKIKTRGRV